MSPTTSPTPSRATAGRVIGALILLAAAVTGLAVYRETDLHPRTDDAEVFANLIGIAPEVSGRIVRIAVKDNQLVHRGDLLFEIDPLPYQYALESARSQQAALEGQIEDLRRTIAAQRSAIQSARAHVASSQANIGSAAAGVEAARAGLANARAGVTRAEADAAYAAHNVQRLEPLLARQFVTVDMVEQARTAHTTRIEAVRQARSQLAHAEALLNSAVAAETQTRAGLSQSEAQLDQSRNAVATLEPLVAQREARAAAVKDAAYNLERCRVRAPFDARVTNLILSEGAYAHAGKQAFTLIDTRTWWIMANFRETQVRHIRPGDPADVYLMADPGRRFTGVVDSISFGVTPDMSLVGSYQKEGLPDVQRALNWVHLATRFPVRVRVTDPQAQDFRIGASAMVAVR